MWAHLGPDEIIPILEQAADTLTNKQSEAMDYNQAEIQYHLNHACERSSGTHALGSTTTMLWFGLERCGGALGLLRVHPTMRLSVLWDVLRELTLIGHDASNTWTKIYPAIEENLLEDCKIVEQLQKDESGRVVIHVDTTLARVSTLFNLCLPHAAETITRETVGRVPSAFYILLQRHMEYRKRTKIFGTVYQWFDGRISVKERYKDCLLDGRRMEYYPDGAVMWEENYLRGMLEGKRRQYYPNGKLGLEENFRGGRRHGLRKKWYRDGTFWMMEHYHRANLTTSAHREVDGRYRNLECTKRRRREHRTYEPNKRRKVVADKTTKDFQEGAKYYLSLLNQQRASVIVRSKHNLIGRGVNIVNVPHEWIGDCWKDGFVLDPRRLLVQKSQIRKAVTGLHDDVVRLICREIDSYDPDRETVFFIFTSSKETGTNYIVKRL